MAFPSNTGTKADSLADAWVKVRQIAAQIKGGAASIGNATGDISALTVINFRNAIATYKAQLNILRLIPGLAQYARDQLGDQGMDLGADFTAMLAAIDDVLAIAVPNDGTYLLVVVGNVDGTFSWRMFPQGQTATLRTACLALAATID